MSVFVVFLLFCFQLTFYGMIHAFYMRLFTTKDVLATIKSLARRDFKSRKAFEYLRQMIVFPTEVYGRVFYKAFEHCHHTLNIQLNCLSVLTVLILYEGTYLVPETQTDPPHLVSVLTFLLHLGLKFHQCTRSLHSTSCIYFAMLLPHSIISYRCSEKANVTVFAQLIFKVASALGKLE